MQALGIVPPPDTPDGEDNDIGHASEGETAMILYHHPELAHPELMPYLPAYDVGFPDNMTGASDFKAARMELGYSGDPKAVLETPEAGRYYFEGIGGAIAWMAGRMVDGEPVYDEARTFLVDIPAFAIPQAIGVAEAAPPEFDEADLADLAAEVIRVQEVYLAGDVEGSLELAEALVERYPGSADAHAWKGIAMGTMAGQADEGKAARYGMGAMGELDVALELDPDSATAWLGQGMLKLYTPADYGGDVDEGIDPLEKALQLSRGTAGESMAHACLGIAWGMKQDRDKALQHLEAALELDPDNQLAQGELERLGR